MDRDKLSFHSDLPRFSRSGLTRLLRGRPTIYETQDLERTAGKVAVRVLCKARRFPQPIMSRRYTLSFGRGLEKLDRHLRETAMAATDNARFDMKTSQSCDRVGLINGKRDIRQWRTQRRAVAPTLMRQPHEAPTAQPLPSLGRCRNRSSAIAARRPTCLSR